MENNIPTAPDTQNNGGKKTYFMGFTTGFLSAVLIALLIVNGPSLYNTYIKHSLDPKVKAEAIYKLMKDRYIDDIDVDKMYEGIYIGMSSLPTDRYSYYMSSEDAEDYNLRTDGNYVGIGIEIQGNAQTKDIEIKKVYNPSPAYDIGIKRGDLLRAAAGVSVSTDNYDEIVDLIRGPENTTVDVTVYRPSEDKEYNFTCYRKNVDINTVFSRMLDDETGYIQITAFEKVTSDQFKTAILNLEASGMKKLVIDLRNNPGGLLTTVTDIADMLIPKGMFTYTEDKYGKKDYIYVDDDYLDIPLSVLVNGSSASASELMSGAIKDTGVGTIVGENTFGKGIVQTTFPLRDGSILKLTTSRYYTPSGVCIDGIGIKPDIEIAAEEGFEMPDLNDENAVIDINADIQLKKALEVLK